MPDLPNITLPQAQYDRVVASFAGTPAQQAQAYRDWTINRLIERVEVQEKRKAEAAVAASLPPRQPEPVIPTLP